ncbi:MAG: PDZ domain-containing protein [Ruminococcaceae bacterium]|nr:PDZ domain-containing protein [Oscillospiraceae bacterium]
MYNENNDPILDNTPSPELPTNEAVQAENAPVASERNEIIYNADKKSDEYNVNYVTTTEKVKKQKTPRPKGYGIKVAAVIIAAIFTLTLCAFMGTYIYKNLTAILSSDVIANLSEKLDIPLGVDKDVFQMEIPKSDSKVQMDQMASVRNDGTGALSVNEIAQKCTKSSVGIMVETTQYYFGRAYAASGVGSGFILSDDGYIATNHHVVENASKITVVLHDGTEYEATLVGSDSITDIAVIKIDAKDLPVMERGNSDEVLVGDLAVAIGTPASIELAGTVTDGIISAVNRKIDITDNYGRVIKTMTLIQTNATINPGNSGGPLINRYGQVIGINTLKLTDQYEGIGFAIPINGAVSIMNQLIADGAVSDRSDSLVTGKASIGIQCVDVTEEEADYYGIPKGVLVMQINKDGSAAKAGLRRGDIIIAFNGKTVESTDEINTIKEDFNAGDKVTLTVFRDGEGNIDITFALDMQTN